MAGPATPCASSSPSGPVAEALSGFRPARRTRGRGGGARRTRSGVCRPSRSSRAARPAGLRAVTVDGYAVRAADTYGASEGLPAYLDVAGAVAMGARPDVDGRAGARSRCRPAACCPRRRRGRDGRAHPGGDARHDRGAAPGRRPATASCAPTRTPSRAPSWLPAGRPLRAQDLGLLAAAGRHRGRGPRPPAGGDRLDRRRGRAAGPRRADAGPGARRHRARARRAGRARRAASPIRAGSCPTTARRWTRRAARRASPTCDVVVVSAGLLGRRPRRDRRGGGRARRAGHLVPRPRAPARASRRCWPTCGGVPVVGLPGNPRSALVVFRLVGMPLVRLVGG